jgi:hypothetical protein
MHKRVSYGLGEKEVVVFWLDSQVLEYRVGPEALHEILADHQRYVTLSSMFHPYPVVYLTMPDGVVDAIAGACCCRKSLVTDEEVQVLGATLPREMSTRSSTASQE